MEHIQHGQLFNIAKKHRDRKNGVTTGRPIFPRIFS